MSTYREALEQLEALSAEESRETKNPLCLRERVGVRVSTLEERPARRLYALTTPIEPAQEAP